MKPSELKQLIKARFDAGIKRPLHIESSPGVGKTQIARQAALEMGVGFICVHAPLMQPEDYGFPVINAARDDVDFIVSKSKFPIEGSDCPDTGVLLMDELPQADAAGQKILANLLQEKEIHGKRLKPGWMLITTGNRASDRAGANRILSHLRNRITTVQLDANLDDWCDWANANKVHNSVVQFMRFRPAMLNSFEANTDINPTPRAWAEGVSPSLGVVSPAQELAVFSGDVGSGGATEFMAFMKVWRELPNPDEVAKNPNKVPVSKEPSVKYAITGALAERANVDTLGPFITYMERLPAEFMVMFIRDVFHRSTVEQKSAYQANPQFVKWLTEAGKFLVNSA